VAKLVTPSVTDLFPACVNVLAEKLCPMHYKDLTQAAWRKLGYRDYEIQQFRTWEDVREKLPMHGKYNVIYTGKPDCLMAKQDWFTGLQMPLLNPDFIIIPGSATSGVNGAFESLMRHGSMLNKYNSPEEERNRRISRGMVIEKHVSDWFRSNYPLFYIPPENERQWTKPCSYDFMIKAGNVRLKVDVSGLNADGAYGNKNKKSTDIHLLCRLVDSSIIWEGIAKGKEFSSTTYPEEATSPMRMVVWLNCIANNINYEQFTQPQVLMQIAA
jgi:hypothetical protein